MTAYRRLRVPGGTYFFTVALEARGSTTLVDRIDALRDAYAHGLRERPVRTEAIAILPDHLHAIWTLPEGDADFSTRWRLIKARFTAAVDPGGAARPSLSARGERGLWQRRFWEHWIRCPADLADHVAWCWTDPVRHGLAARPEAWPWSSTRHAPGTLPVPRDDIDRGEPADRTRLREPGRRRAWPGRGHGPGPDGFSPARSSAGRARTRCPPCPSP